MHRHHVEDGVSALYQPFGHEVLFVKNADFALMESGRHDALPPALFSELVEKRFLVPPGHDAGALAEQITPPIRGFFSLWLLVVQTCNMGCKYCVVDAGDQTRAKSLPALSQQTAKGKMSPEVADAALTKLEASLRKYQRPEARITFYGGETLLNKELLHYAIPRARAIQWPGAKAPITLMLFTNGLLYDPELTRLFQQYDVTVGLSIDGMREHHDSTRVTLGGKGTHDKVVESYRRYRDAGLNVGVSCTIGKHNVDDLPEIARYFIDELGVPAAQFQTPIQMPASQSKHYVPMGKAVHGAMEAYRLFRDAGIDEGLAMRRLSMFVGGHFHKRDCLAVGGELAVAPDGSVGPCHNATIGSDSPFQGNILDPGLDPEKLGPFAEWHARMPLNQTACHDCSFIGLCGGGCPLNAQLAEGSIWDKDPHQCGYMLGLVNWLLEDIWQRSRVLAGG